MILSSIALIKLHELLLKFNLTFSVLLSGGVKYTNTDAKYMKKIKIMKLWKIMYSNTKSINMSAFFIFLLILVTITQRTLSIEIRRGLKDSIKVSDLKGPSWKFGCGPIWNDKDWCQCDRANINTIQSNSNGKGSCKNICK